MMLTKLQVDFLCKSAPLMRVRGTQYGTRCSGIWHDMCKNLQLVDFTTFTISASWEASASEGGPLNGVMGVYSHYPISL